MRFVKYHALGNDYLVLPPVELPADSPTRPPGEPSGTLDPALVRRICHRHTGAGSDGILFGPLATGEADFALRIFNPDGSEAEKSGNGLRIFARYLWDQGLVSGHPFTVLTPGGRVRCQVLAGGRTVIVEMGQASFDSRRIPVAGPSREVLDEPLLLDGQELRFCAVTLGNPHCVIFRDEISPEQAQQWGPRIEHDPRFPNRTNVQFAKVLDRANLQLEIWERGAGYTLASGSSSCAAAAAAYRLGLCQAEVSVHMPGGCLEVAISQGLYLTLTGPVAKVYTGELSLE